jgi:hypothetical protein
MNSHHGEQCRFARHPPDAGVAAHLAVRIEPDYGQASVRSISQGTISILLNRRIEPQAIVPLELCNGHNRFVLRTAMQVSYVIAARNADYILGGPFVRELDEGDLRMLLESSLPLPSVVVASA